ncbi:MAG: transporter permease [Clostridia bacterium]|jgi:multiple sugar transport system permease protein|nr:transporter permease [Clostridia bacterium]
MSKKRRLSAEQKEALIGYLFVLPAVIYMIGLIGYPIIYNFVLSFQEVDVMTIKSSVRAFVGLKNYQDILKEGLIAITIKNTLFYTIWCLIIQFTIGFALALFFNKKFRLSEPIRGLMVISWMMPMTVTALLFKFMLSPSNGILNDFLVALRIVNEPVGWLINAETAMWGAIIANSWVGIPFNMILLTTGLSNIPYDIYESASIDGADSIKRFWYITLPLLRPAILSVLILGFIYTFKVFDLIFVMTAGGPVNATEVLSTYSYQLSFKHYNFSQGAAVANILFICLFAVSLFYLKLIKGEEVMQ